MAHSHHHAGPTSLVEHPDRKHHHHSRRGRHHGAEKKASRPSSRSRKVASMATLSKLGSRPRSRVRDSEDDCHHETFPHYCMGCDKEFFPADSDTVLYCSESCQSQDQSSMHPHAYGSYADHPELALDNALFPPSSTRKLDGPDIVPQAAPSKFPFTGSDYDDDDDDDDHHAGQTSPASAFARAGSLKTSESYTALASLQNLATTLPSLPPASTTTPFFSSSSTASSFVCSSDARRTTTSSTRRTPARPTSGLWTYMPFSSSISTVFATSCSSPPHGASSPTSTDTPLTSARPTSVLAAAHHHHVPPSSKRHSMHELHAQSARNRDDLVAYSASIGLGMDRPLPPRSGPLTYGKRTRAVDLVTPIGRHVV